MKRVYECEVVSQTKPAPGFAQTVLQGPEIAQSGMPGQFVNVRITKTTDPLLRRPFSIHTVDPDRGTFTLLYVIRGRGTELLARVPPGDKLSILGPLGRPFDVGNSRDALHVLVAGGCGVVPLRFLCESLCLQFGPERVIAFVGAQTKDEVLCEDEFRKLGVDIEVCTNDGSRGTQALVTQMFCNRLQSFLDAEQGSSLRVYACGPREMLKEVARICADAGIKSCQLSLENVMACGLGVCLGCVQKIKDGQEDWHYERVCTEGPVFEAREIVWD
jgi:dihydroorotate dehydrogenase electron transfer subunit